MTPERWHRIEQIFHSVLEYAPEQRNAFLENACQGDLSLRREIESLIASDEAAAGSLFMAASVNSERALPSLEKLIGQVLDDKYRIEKQLGQGGMGAVYLATHLGTKRTVALKIIAPQFMSNNEFVERFKREAEVTGRLRHPNIVNTTDFGFATVGSDRMAYMVMEYLNGGTLGDLLKQQQKLPLEFVVDTVEQICLAISEAHKQGIIHRDLKPDNIWLEPNGRGGYNIKVLDFGLAKLRDLDAAQQEMPQLPSIFSSLRQLIQGNKEHSQTSDQITLNQPLPVRESETLKEEDTKIINKGATVGAMNPGTIPEWLTRIGTILGTPLYMSPEQCQGRSLTAQSDIYSVGIISYEMLTGEPPFKGDLHQLITQHQGNRPVSLKERRPDLPKAVAEQVMQALAKNPEARPASATAFAMALRANAEDESSLMRKTIAIYSQNFTLFQQLSLLAYLPMLLVITALICLPILISLENIFYWHCFLLLAMMIPFTNLISGVITGGPIVQLIVAKFYGLDTNIDRQQIISNFKKRLPAFLRTSVLALRRMVMVLLVVTIYSDLFILFSKKLNIIYVSLFGLAMIIFMFFVEKWAIKDMATTLFFAPAVMLEGREGQPALNRSEELFARINNRRGNIFMILLSISLSVALLAFALVSMVAKFIHDSVNIFENISLVIAAIFGLLVSLFIVVMIAPLLSIGYSLTYLKARQSGGETLEEIIGKVEAEKKLADGEGLIIKQ